MLDNKDRNELLVIEAVMRLKNLKDMDRVKKEGERLYSHTNSRGRKRYIQICTSQSKARIHAEENEGSYFKSFGSWISLYEQKKEER